MPAIISKFDHVTYAKIKRLQVDKNTAEEDCHKLKQERNW